MDLEIIRNHCLQKKGVTEGFPFDDTTLVFKVLNKMFCLSSLEPPISINLKSDPEEAVENREKYDAVSPGYHMNKKHWNSIALDNSIPDTKILMWVDKSYELVVGGMSKKEKEELEK